MADHCMVVTTTDSAEAAEQLARGVVEARLAACAQIVGPMTSIYRWEGAVQTEQEWQLWIKTTTVRLHALTAHLQANHSYAVPEVVALPITGGSLPYLQWVTTQTQPL